MRKLFISLVTMGITSLGFAQNSYHEFQQFIFKDFHGPGSNYKYLNEVQNDLTPNQVKYIEDAVSYWDIARLEKFEGRRNEEFDVTFKSNLGYIVATYDNQGKVVSAEERFKNVALPRPLIMAITEQYPNWRIIKTRYLVRNKKDDRSKRHFKVRIMKGNQKKWLKVDPEGKIS